MHCKLVNSNPIDTHHPSAIIFIFEYLPVVHLPSEQQGPNDGLESDHGNDAGHFTIFAIVDRKCFSDSDASRVNISIRFSGFYVISCRSVRCRRLAVCVCVGRCVYVFDVRARVQFRRLWDTEKNLYECVHFVCLQCAIERRKRVVYASSLLVRITTIRQHIIHANKRHSVRKCHSVTCRVPHTHTASDVYQIYELTYLYTGGCTRRIRTLFIHFLFRFVLCSNIWYRN